VTDDRLAGDGQELLRRLGAEAGAGTGSDEDGRDAHGADRCRPVLIPSMRAASGRVLGLPPQRLGVDVALQRLYIV
jgi:hypothetical protein